MENKPSKVNLIPGKLSGYELKEASEDVTRYYPKEALAYIEKHDLTNIQLLLCRSTLIDLRERIKAGTMMRGRGVCNNWLLSILAPNFSPYSLVHTYTGITTPIRDYGINSFGNTLWEGNQLRVRLRLVDRLINLFDYAISKRVRDNEQQ